MATLLEQELDQIGESAVTLEYHGQHGFPVGWTATVDGHTFNASDLTRAIIGAAREAGHPPDPPEVPEGKKTAAKTADKA